MSRLIPVIYKNMNYPSHIEANIHEVSGNFYKEKIIVKTPYSLHTEPSSIPKTFCSKIVNDLEFINKAQKGNIAQLWRNKEWAYEFFLFIEWLIGSNKPPEVLEIHPPFDDYCKSYDQFLDVFDVFFQKFINKYPITTILIENRFGTRYKGGRFLLSTCSDVLFFCKILSQSHIKLKIVLDYPQLFSAETEKGKTAKHPFEPDSDQLFENIMSFNWKIKEYSELIGGFHMWGKLKNGNRWTPHAGNFDTFFNNNKILKETFLNSVFTTFNDDKARYFVPEVNSGVSDFHSIVTDMEKAGFIFLSKNCYKFYKYKFFGINIPTNNIDIRKNGFFEKDGWLIQFCFGKKDGKEYMDLYCSHRMTNDRHERIYEDGTVEGLPAIDYFSYGYDPNDPEDVNEEREKNKLNEIKKLLSEKGFYPFPQANDFINNINNNIKNNM